LKSDENSGEKKERTIKEMKISPAAHKRLMQRKSEDGLKTVTEVIMKYVPEV